MLRHDVGSIAVAVCVLVADAARNAMSGQLIEPRELLLVDDGRILHRNPRREFTTVTDLHAKTSARFESPTWESDGEVSMITRRNETRRPRRSVRGASGA